MITQRDGSTEQPASGGSTLRVICVDDEPGLAEAMSTALEHVDDDIQATSTEDPEKALRCVREEAFDCVISDYEMPGRDGAWLCEQIASHDPNVPFILYTGHPASSIPLGENSKLDGVTTVVRKERGMSHYAILAEQIRQAIAIETEW